MLTALHIRDFVLIGEASLSVSQGLTVLTGETGAGKSILLDALGLAAGSRSARAAVRPGAAQGVVAASFEPPASHSVWNVLSENGVPAEDESVILRRVQSPAGKSRAFINDQPVSVGLLRRVGETLLEVHGQHDGQGFLSPDAHLQLLDAYAGVDAEAQRVSAAFRAVHDVRALLEDAEAQTARASNEAEYLSHVVEELSVLDPQADEEPRLARRRAELMSAERVREDMAAALVAMGDDGIEDKLSVAARRIGAAGDAFEDGRSLLGDAAEAIETALSAVMEARGAVEDAAAALDVDDEELQSVDDRLFALRAAARKHAVAPSELPTFLAKAQQALSAVAADEAGRAALAGELERCQAAYDGAAAELSKLRGSAAKKLASAVARELEPLKLGKAKFSVQMKTVSENRRSSGVDQVEFLVSTNAGGAPGPLRTIASGGELSRFVLAMKAALAAKENRTVIIFDEVDAGVGGAVADAVGERLSKLAGEAQVLVVTHSPQVAARARWHWCVEKTQLSDGAKTTVRELSGQDRTEEIARMLSGAKVTRAARAAAESLLKDAEPRKPKRTRRAASG